MVFAEEVGFFAVAFFAVAFFAVAFFALAFFALDFFARADVFFFAVRFVAMWTHFLVCVALSGAPDAGTPLPERIDPVAATRFIHGSPPHGVPGPWALSGFRIGANALKRFGLAPAQSWELDVVHRAVPNVRYTCMADGVMASTGVSPGKMNLSVEKVATEDEIETVVTHKKSGKQLVYRLKKSFRDRIRDVDYAQFPEAAKKLESTTDDEMFTVEERAPAASK